MSGGTVSREAACNPDLSSRRTRSNKEGGSRPPAGWDTMRTQDATGIGLIRLARSTA